LIALKYILLGLAHRIGEKEKQRKIIWRTSSWLTACALADAVPKTMPALSL
jgi:hypothetical protein